ASTCSSVRSTRLLPWTARIGRSLSRRRTTACGQGRGCA
ncbi:MAG: hypothetical protein AVDCRST_MAG27-2487, partial [uncultured Craurococcus sp.]